MITTFEIPTLEHLPVVARDFLQTIAPLQRPIVAFIAPMGTGKTTFVKALCEAQGCEDDTNSPTFAIVNEYRTMRGDPIFHIDCYRLNDLEEALEIGITDYLQSGYPCYIEWPEVIEEVLPKEQTVTVQLEAHPNGKRTLTICL